ncbi:MAG: hypothetical protein B6241_10585 [Spirochaetaceae bacterium 4572_59]|nr:MAG: hypothetical protein B6241_10585 [Spirochaetaceae bacterium 4572_59]
MRKKRKDRISRIISPTPRFWTGLTLIPGYFLIDNLFLKLMLVGFFAFMVLLAGKRIRYFYFTMMTLSITFFHILTPVGQILWTMGPLAVTAGALYTGFLKGVTLSGLVFLSLFSVTPALKLPGKLGGLLGKMFYYFEEILDGRKRVQAWDFIGSLDNILMEIFPPADLPSPQVKKGETRKSYPFKILYILLLELSVWGTVICLL